MDYLPCLAKLVWIFRTCSVVIRRRPRIFTVVIAEFSGFPFEKLFDLFILLCKLFMTMLMCREKGISKKGEKKRFVIHYKIKKTLGICNLSFIRK